MSELFNFEVHTPYRLFFSGKAQVITLPLVDGEIGVYAHHSPFTAPVITGILRIKDGKGEWRPAFITDGILEVKDHKNVLMVDAAEWPEEIDCERAKQAKEQAEQSLAAGILKFEAENIAVSLKRANMRIKAAEEGKG